jgi:hypothetical protein
MATYKIPDSPKKYKTEYSKFKGVDLSSNPTQVDSTRGAMGTVNLISDSGGFPEKRKGWRVLQTCEAPVNGLYRGVIKGKEYFLVHGGTKLYQWTDSSIKELKSGLTNGKGTAFTLNDKIYVLTGGEYLVFDGETVKDATADAYVPTTSIANKPEGGGTSFEDVNLLSSKRKNEFCADGSATVYQLDTTDVESIAEVKVDAKVWESSKYTLDGKKGQVKFTTAPPKPSIAGKDNVTITFVKTVEGYKDKIIKCTIAGIYGGKSQDRVFLSGNPDAQDTDWRCESNNPLYFSDLSYTKVGADGAAIVGYSAISDSQAIIKADDRSETTIYFRGYNIDTTTSKVQFPVRRAAAGAGAVAKRAFAYLPEEPVFLSRTGVFALTSSNITALQVARNRSYYVDAALTKEEHLENACAVVWNGYYVLAVNGHAYVLDTNQNVAYKPQSYGDYVYECYYWNNFPAVRMMESRGNLYFGTSDGRICKLNTDIDTMQEYSDGGTLGEDGRITGGTAISAEWHTKADDDGDFMTYKTMVKRGSGVMMKPYTRSSIQVYARTERDFGRKIREGIADIFSWTDIDFSRFTFNSNDAPQVLPFNSKVKKYKTLQLIMKNDAMNEAFGIFGIIKRYTIGTSVR